MTLQVSFRYAGRDWAFEFNPSTHRDKATDHETVNEYYVGRDGYTFCVNIPKEEGRMVLTQGAFIDWVREPGDDDGTELYIDTFHAELKVLTK